MTIVLLHHVTTHCPYIHCFNCITCSCFACFTFPYSKKKKKRNEHSRIPQWSEAHFSLGFFQLVPSCPRLDHVWARKHKKESLYSLLDTNTREMFNSANSWKRTLELNTIQNSQSIGTIRAIKRGQVSMSIAAVHSVLSTKSQVGDNGKAIHVG